MDYCHAHEGGKRDADYYSRKKYRTYRIIYNKEKDYDYNTEPDYYSDLEQNA